MDKESLKRLHNELLEIYEEIARVCDAHNLSYFVIGGTLLGAEIHKGFIPWDDDLDIGMPREDYEKFIKLCPKELKDKYYLHDITTDENYWVAFAKVCKKGTVLVEEKLTEKKEHDGIYVDVCPFDYTNKCVFNTIDRIKWRIIAWLINYISSVGTNQPIRSSKAKLLARVFSRFSIKKLALFRDKLIKSYDKGKHSYFIDLAGGRSLENSCFRYDVIMPLKKMIFGNTTVVAPNNPESYLTQLYTEKYKIIPPIEEQVTRHAPVYIRFEDGTEFRKEISQ